MVDPSLRVEEVDGVFFLRALVEKASSVKWQECEARANRKIDLSGKDPTAQEDFIAVAQGAKNIDTGVRNSSVHNTFKEVRTLVDGMAGDHAAQRMSNDGSASLTCRCVRSVTTKGL